MNRSKELKKTIKPLIRLFVLIMKRIGVLAPYIAKTIFENISKQLRFSITFKAAVNYSFTFARIYFLLCFLIVVSFGGYLFFETQTFLHNSVKITEGFLAKGLTNGKKELKNYGEIEDINITLLNQDNKKAFTTSDIGQLPTQVVESKDLTVVNQRAFLKVELASNSSVKYIVVSQSIVKEIIYLVLLTIGLTMSFIIAIVIIVIRGSKNLKKMLKPIDDMIRTARSISAEDLRTRLNVGNSHDELKELAETFNEMLERIQSSYEKQNRFVSDASHELRTPISVIQGYANLLQRWGKEDKEVLAESIEAIKNETDNMKELVERLLFLARADKDTQKVEKSTFAFNELIDEIIRETKMIDNKHKIVSEGNHVINLNADRGLIKQALRVFIDNSIKFTSLGGIIKINSYSENGQVKVMIEDNGIGIPAADLPYIFDRFYKCDESRTRNNGGTGLGLSIAKWIIEKHNGKIKVESSLGKGTTIEIVIPV